MINKLKPKSEFSRNVLTLMTGTTIAQAIPIAISPILTRIYTPEDFGLYGLFIAISSIFGSIANAKYEIAIILPKKDEDAINIFALGFIINIAISLLLLFVVFFFNNSLTTLLGSKDIGMWLYFVPIVVFFTGIFNILYYFNNRKKRYQDIANSIIVKSIIAAVIQLVIGFVKSGATGLISGQLISQIFANMRLFKNIIKDKLLISKISKVKIIAVAKKYKNSFIHNTPASLTDIATLQMPFIFIIKIANEAISGYYFLSYRIIMLPSSLIGNSIATVYFQKLSENKNKNKISMPLLIRTIQKLFYIALPLVILLFLSSPYTFRFIFGNNWEDAGTIAQYLSLVLLIRFIVSPVSTIFSLNEFLKRGAFWKYLYFTTSLSLYSYAIYTQMDIFYFLFIFVIHEYILYVIYLCLIIISVREMDTRIINVRN